MPRRCALSVSFVHVLYATLLAWGAPSASAHAADHAGPVIVNAVALNAETLAALQRIYPVPIRPGRYWYDAVSGAYGAEGGPVAGQMSPGLPLGGPLHTRTFCDPDGSCRSSGILGSILTVPR